MIINWGKRERNANGNNTKLNKTTTKTETKIFEYSDNADTTVVLSYKPYTKISI